MSAILVALLTASLVAQNRGPFELATAPVPPGAKRLTYGSDPLHFGELRLPPTKGPHPVAIVIHGGCWSATLGKLDPRAVAIDNMRPLAAALTDAGIATWNIEYRRLGNEGGGWPGSFRDVASAADYLRTLARDNNLNLDRVISIGHSAGAHFALWLAARHKVPKSSDVYTSNPLRLAGVVSLDGPADLKAALSMQQPVCGSPVITNVMGGSPEERADRYAAGSPIELLPMGVPSAFLAGRMFDHQVVPFEAASKKAGDRTQVFSDPKASHFVFIDPQSEMWPRVMSSIRALLQMN